MTWKQLAYGWEATIAALEADAEAEDDIDDEDQETLRLYREELGLRPWACVGERLTALERRKRFILRFDTVCSAG